MSNYLHLDLTGLRCPTSTMLLKKKLSSMGVGDHIRILTDDKEADVDFLATFKLSGADDVGREYLASGLRAFNAKKVR